MASSLLNRVRDTLSSSSPFSSAKMAAPLDALPPHPYYPIEAKIVGYLANEWNTFELCGIFAAGCTVIFSVTYLVTTRLRPHVSVSDLATVMWFVLCECCRGEGDKRKLIDGRRIHSLFLRGLLRV
jgi:cholestenol delta-isomerase